MNINSFCSRAALAFVAAFLAFCGSVSAADRHAAEAAPDAAPLAPKPSFKVVIDTSAAPEYVLTHSVSV